MTAVGAWKSLVDVHMAANQPYKTVLENLCALLSNVIMKWVNQNMIKLHYVIYCI